MKAIWIIPIFIALLSANAMAFNITTIPESFSPNVNISSVTSYTLMLNQTELGTNATNVYFSSNYYSGFNPTNFTLVDKQFVTFSLTAPNTTGAFTDSIKIYVNGTLIKTIQSNFYVQNLTELGPGSFVYMKCYLINGILNCDPIENITGNGTVVNITNTTEVRYYAMSEQFLQNFTEFMSANLEKYSNIEDIVNRTLSEAETQSENAWQLEAVLKNPNNPTWVLISPQNQLLNLTGMTEQDLNIAIGKLTAQNRITQKVEIVNQENTQNGMTSIYPVSYIYFASTERLSIEEKDRNFRNLIIWVMVLAILSILIVLFYKLYWSKRPTLGRVF